jgi:hypothetical protein
MATHFHREQDLILVQIKPDDPPDDWKPTHTFNLISDLSIALCVCGTPSPLRFMMNCLYEYNNDSDAEQ